jgi:hypothetical protein
MAGHTGDTNWKKTMKVILRQAATAGRRQARLRDSAAIRGQSMAGKVIAVNPPKRKGADF